MKKRYLFTINLFTFFISLAAFADKELITSRENIEMCAPKWKGDGFYPCDHQKYNDLKREIEEELKRQNRVACSRLGQEAIESYQYFRMKCELTNAGNRGIYKCKTTMECKGKTPFAPAPQNRYEEGTGSGD